MKRKLTFIAVLFLTGCLLLEAGSCVLMKTNVLHGEMPTFSWNRQGTSFFRDVPAQWATWHEPNSSSRHVLTCADLRYQFNAEGMRDRPRERQGSPSRVVVLGDSFIEGWGAQEADRLTNLLESAKGKEFLNFGTSGSFGPLQFYLIYDHLAKFFAHESVLVGIFPANDFDDDDYKHWMEKGRRRPFWVGQAPNFSLAYSQVKSKTFFQRYLRPFFKEFSYFYNAAEDLYDGLTHRAHNKKARVSSRFYDFTEEEWQRMLFSLQKLREASQGKKLTLMLIPMIADLKRYDQDGKSPLASKLEAWGEGRDVVVIDLLPWLHDYQKDWMAYSLPCDGHWSAQGHRAVFELVQKYF
jgi:hypothetical protein